MIATHRQWFFSLCLWAMLIDQTVWANRANHDIAAIPHMIPLQGYLVDGQQTPLEGPHDLTLSLYTSLAASIAVWSEIQSGVPFERGQFATYLGLVTPLVLEELIAAPELWLSIAVDADQETTRIRLATVPYAFSAQQCQQVGRLSEADIQPLLHAACSGDRFLQGWDTTSQSPICATAALPGHEHDTRYPTRDELVTPGTLNATDNLVHWTNLLGVPGGFADGLDDVGHYTGADFAVSDQQCNAGQVVQGVDDTGGLTCIADEANVYTGADFALSNQDCGVGLVASGVDTAGELVCETDRDSLGSLSCQNGQVPKWEQDAARWECADDQWLAPYNYAQLYDDVHETPSTSWTATNRTVTINKLADNTILKITHADNFYIYGPSGAQKQCEWKITIDGGDCTDPSRLEYYYTYLSDLTHIHTSNTNIGLCRAIATGPIESGQHTIRIFARRGNSDSTCRLGSNSTALLIVEELGNPS